MSPTPDVPSAKLRLSEDRLPKLPCAAESAQRFDQKKSRRILAQIDGRYRDLIDGISDLVQSTCGEGRIELVNAAWLSTLGYSLDEVVGRPIADFVHSDCRQCFSEAFADLLAGETSRRIETKFVGKDGAIVPVEGCVTGKSVQGRLSATHGSFRVVAEADAIAINHHGQNQVLELLAQGASLAAVLDKLVEVSEVSRPGMIGSILLTDQQTGLLHHGASRQLPKSYCEAIDGVLPGPSTGSCGTAAFLKKRVIVENIQTHPFWKDYRGLAEDAGLHACWSEPILSSDGSVLGTLAMYYREPRTPTEMELQFASSYANLAALAIQRVRSQQVIMENERRLSKLLDNLPGAAYRVLNEENYSFEFISHGVTDIIGYTPAELVSGVPAWRDLVHPDDLARVHAQFDEGIASKQVFEMVYRVIHRGGTDVWVWERAEGVYAEDGKLIALEGFVVDMTELQRTREQLVQSERLSAIGETMSGLVHESRNALARSQAGLRLLSREVGEDPKRARYINEALRAQEDVTHLFEAVRQYAVPVRLKCTSVCAAKITEGAWAKLANVIEGRDVKLTQQHADVDTVCWLDPLAIGNVLRNLIKNSLAACSEPIEITVSYRRTKLASLPALEITVRDNGPGLSQETAERAFDAFYTTRTHGTGLGLAISRRVIEAHNGTIQLGATDDGAEFVITLPTESV